MKRLIDRFFAIRAPIKLQWALLLGVVPFLVTLALWVWYTRGASVEDRRGGLSMPQPEEVAKEGWKLLGKKDTRNVYKEITASLKRVAIGFGVALSISLPLGIAMGSFSRVGALFRPMSVVGGYVPIAALVPLTLLFWGTEEEQKVYFLAIAGTLYLLPLVVKSVEQVDDVYLQTAYTLGATKRHTVTRVMVPIAAGDIFDAVRMAFGVGWTYIMLAEIVDQKEGLGAMIQIAQRRGHPETVYFVVLLIVAIGFLIDRGFAWVGKQAFPWRSAR
ncbi:MAG: NitT/TauT family transport system permease [Planctomycetota bacterium]|nr:MAG: NitT/TauT family transport system permease [Planctomycetota bacterium]